MAVKISPVWKLAIVAIITYWLVPGAGEAAVGIEVVARLADSASVTDALAAMFTGEPLHEVE